MRQYEFHEKLKASEGVCESASIESIVLSSIAGAVSVVKSTECDDRNGTDWWVECENNNRLSIDAKVRDQDWSRKGHDDLALETFSVVEKNIYGWTLDKTKRTDFILWLWKDTGRWCMVPFPMLCTVFHENLAAWVAKYKVARQFTPRVGGGYHSECVFVPRRELWATIYKRYSGAV
jgi:hypothetical protein